MNDETKADVIERLEKDAAACDGSAKFWEGMIKTAKENARKARLLIADIKKEGE